DRPSRPSRARTPRGPPASSQDEAADRSAPLLPVDLDLHPLLERAVPLHGEAVLADDLRDLVGDGALLGLVVRARAVGEEQAPVLDGPLGVLLVKEDVAARALGELAADLGE